MEYKELWNELSKRLAVAENHIQTLIAERKIDYTEFNRLRAKRTGIELVRGYMDEMERDIKSPVLRERIG